MQAERIHGLFGRLQNVKRLHMFCGKEAITRTSTVIKIWCDQDSRLPMLQVLSSIEARVLATTAVWMVFEIIGPSDRLSELHDALYPYGIIESFSAASLIAHTETEELDGQKARFSVV